MSISHLVERRGDRTLDVLTDDENGLQLTISRLGAELVSVARRNAAGAWVGFLHRDNDLAAPASGWGNHATVMGYFLHRLKEGHSLYRGRCIEGGTHSFLRTKIWHLLERKDSDPSIAYRITPDDFTPTEYPLKVGLDLTYRIDRDRVVTTFVFRNNEPELTAHVEFGLHPGFGASSFSCFEFYLAPGVYRRHFAPGNYLSGETQDIESAGGLMPFARQDLPGSFILELIDVPNPEFRFFDPPSGREVKLDFAGVPYVTLWSDGGPFLCVEPCWGLTDRHDQRAFEAKEGIQVIPAGGSLRATFAMSPRLIA